MFLKNWLTSLNSLHTKGTVAKQKVFPVLTSVLPYKIISMIASKIFALVSSGSSLDILPSLTFIVHDSLCR